MKVAAPGSKWSRRATKYVSVRIEVGTYARITFLARERGVTRGRMMGLLLDYFDAGILTHKKERLKGTAKVEEVEFT